MMRWLVFILAFYLATAQGYPTKPLRVILANPPGGTADALARVLSDGLAKTFGQPFVIENRAGPNGSTGRPL